MEVAPDAIGEDNSDVEIKRFDGLVNGMKVELMVN